LSQTITYEDVLYKIVMVLQHKGGAKNHRIVLESENGQYSYPNLTDVCLRAKSSEPMQPPLEPYTKEEFEAVVAAVSNDDAF
jgi:hypothetical protein